MNYQEGSVITAVGMANQIWVMVTAVIVAVCVMLLVSGKIASFIDRHPTVKILARILDGTTSRCSSRASARCRCFA